MSSRFSVLAASLVCGLTLLPGQGMAQATATIEPEFARSVDFPLTIQSIMRGPELVGSSPQGVRWTDDAQWIYFRWLPGGGVWDDSAEMYRVPAEGGEPEPVDDEMADSIAVFISGGDLSTNRRLRITSVEGDLYLVDRRDLSYTRLTETSEAERFPRFSADGSRVLFVQGDNVFSLSLQGAGLRQVTDIRSGSPPEDDPDAQGHKAFLENQQEELFQHIERLKAEAEEREAERDARAEGDPEPFYVPRGERIQSLQVDPTGRFVAISFSRSADGAQRTVVPRWVTESGYTEDLNVRTKVGDAQSTTRIGLLNTTTGEMTWLDLFPDDDDPGGEDEEAGEAESAEERTGNDHPDLSIAAFGGWNDDGTHGLLFSVSYDNKTRWLFSVEAATGELTLLDTLHDEAWVAGPCFFGCQGWLPESARVYFVSEATGYAHVYSVNADGSEKAQLTEGEWEVLQVEIPEGRESFLIHSNEGSPFNQHVYTMRFDGSRRTPLTSGPGSFQATPSPDGRRLAVVHSKANRPGELFLADFGGDAELDQVTVSPTVEWLTFPWIEPDIIRFPAQDGAQVPARIYRPSDVGAEANGAAVVFVHGAGYLHNVHNYWSSYYREYMFNHFLAANGYTVLDVDYRGSAGYGRDWRTGIYRWMGGKDLSDQVDGVTYLVANEGVDPQRVGLYGGSYGGFITLMALFTEPDVFTAGAALRSVTDWAHYNHGYTSRILNLPQEDEEAYEKSSPIYFAEGFRGHLLMAHGMVDTNVHFSDVVRLAQRLIELGKENWEMAVYPVENHGFAEPTSWTDEYRRIFELFERTIGDPAK
ncbi:prolyl oligopeptidase family serine peptidase [Gemmatimonadota bacterium]